MPKYITTNSTDEIPAGLGIVLSSEIEPERYFNPRDVSVVRIGDNSSYSKIYITNNNISINIFFNIESNSRNDSNWILNKLGYYPYIILKIKEGT